MMSEIKTLEIAITHFQQCMADLSKSVHTLLERQRIATQMLKAMLAEQNYDPKYLRQLVELLS
jgi:cell division protein FtsL